MEALLIGVLEEEIVNVVITLNCIFFNPPPSQKKITSIHNCD